MLGYIDSIENFLKTPTQNIISLLTNIYPEANNSQINSWQVLMDDIKSCTAINNFNKQILIGIEYFLSVESMSIDAFFLGRNSSGENSLYIIESKQWSDEYINTNVFSKYRENNKLLHPQVQVSRHEKAIKSYLDIGERIQNITPFVFLRNATSGGCEKMYNLNNDTDSSAVPILNNLTDLLTFISNELPNISEIQISDLQNATYYPSQGIMDSMESIITKETPFILTEEQEKALVEILNAIKEGKRVIRVMGAAGSGKTAILLNIYVRMLQKRSRYTPYFVSGAQNTALYRETYPDVASSFNYTLNLAQSIVRGNVKHPIILLDEAQHNKPGIISELLSLNSIIILCYDEWQTINAHNSLMELEQLENSYEFTTIFLNDSVRFNGSNVFEKNIKRILQGDSEIEKDNRFEFGICKSLKDIEKITLDIISKKPDATVAVVGLLSDDDRQTAKDSDGFFFVNWTNKAESKWMPYVRGKEYLSQNNGSLWAGTWWMPGLDVDYVIVIGGNDAILTSDGFIGNPNHSRNYTMMLSIAEVIGIPEKIFSSGSSSNKVKEILKYLDLPQNKDLKNQFIREFSFYLRNMYYILLTRGRKGCYMYFKNNRLT